jgi:hypothetical protein
MADFAGSDGFCGWHPQSPHQGQNGQFLRAVPTKRWANFNIKQHKMGQITTIGFKPQKTSELGKF